MTTPKDISSDRLAVRRALDAIESYIISPVFPCGALHLVVGDSGMGKSTWFLDILHDWSLGNSVLGGLTSTPCEWVYVSMDRSLRDTNRTLRRLGLQNWDIPAYSIEELCARDEQGQLVAPTLQHIHKLFPHAKLIALEGLQTIIPNTTRGQSQNKAEAMWLMDIRDKILNKGVTVIASEHIPKGSDGNTTRTRRNTALGSASLIGGSGTIVSFDYPESAKQGNKVTYTDERVVHLSGHNFAPYALEYSRDNDGRFILQSTRNGKDTYTHLTEDDELIQIDTQLSAWPVENTLRSSDFQTWGKVCSMSESSVFRWLKHQVTSGRLEMVKRGEYRKVRTQ